MQCRSLLGVHRSLERCLPLRENCTSQRTLTELVSHVFMGKVTSVLAPKFQASDPDVQVDPYPTYARLRESARFAGQDQASLPSPRYADVAALLADSRLRSEFPLEYSRLSAGTGPG